MGATDSGVDPASWRRNDMAQRTISVDIMGAINDHKLKAKVTGRIEDTTGEGELEFKYEEIPPAPYWHPLNYTDPLVLVPAYQNRTRDAMRFPTLGSFTAQCTMDFGDGLLLRKGATIYVSGGNHTGGYYIMGTARSGEIPDALGAKHNAPYVYREFLHPAGPGDIIGVGHTQWTRLREAGRQAGGPIDAIVSCRYRFHEWKGVLPGHFVRILEIPEAVWNPATKTVKAGFSTRVENL
jgi:hypothetical protein